MARLGFLMLTLLKTFLIIRPHNIAAAVLSVAAGFALAGGEGWPWRLLLTTALVTAAVWRLRRQRRGERAVLNSSQ